MIGWIANVFLLLGMWFIGSSKVALGLCVSMVGTALWFVKAVEMKEADLIFINTAFAILTIRAILKFLSLEKIGAKTGEL
jgi:hypothetical protein